MGAIPCIKHLKTNARKRKKQEELRKKQEELQKRAKLVELFPIPWLEAYDECKSVGGYRTRLVWLEMWLDQIKHQAPKAPKLTMPAIKKFAEMAGESTDDGDFRTVFKMLMPYYQWPLRLH